MTIEKSLVVARPRKGPVIDVLPLPVTAPAETLAQRLERLAKPFAVDTKLHIVPQTQAAMRFMQYLLHKPKLIEKMLLGLENGLAQWLDSEESTTR